MNFSAATIRHACQSAIETMQLAKICALVMMLVPTDATQTVTLTTADLKAGFKPKLDH